MIDKPRARAGTSRSARAAWIETRPPCRWSLKPEVAVRTGRVDRNISICMPVAVLAPSRSARAAWIETLLCWAHGHPADVAVRTGRVDRNTHVVAHGDREVGRGPHGPCG